MIMAEWVNELKKLMVLTLLGWGIPFVGFVIKIKIRPHIRVQSTQL